MTFMLRGALVEYGSDFLGPLPNVVIFQFNPESINRTIEIPKRPTTATAKESTQAGEAPVEKFTIKAQFDASDRLNAVVDVSLARVLGIGPQLVSLERMARPTAGVISGLIGAGVDKVAGLVGLGGGGDAPVQPIPREKYPRILFIWGPARIQPVVIESMAINELQYDYLLNPTRAEVTIGLAVRSLEACSDDIIAKGATVLTDTIKETQSLVNLAISTEAVVEMIPF